MWIHPRWLTVCCYGQSRTSTILFFSVGGKYCFCNVKQSYSKGVLLVIICVSGLARTFLFSLSKKMFSGYLFNLKLEVLVPMHVCMCAVDPWLWFCFSQHSQIALKIIHFAMWSNNNYGIKLCPPPKKPVPTLSLTLFFSQPTSWSSHWRIVNCLIQHMHRSNEPNRGSIWFWKNTHWLSPLLYNSHVPHSVFSQQARTFASPIEIVVHW